MRIIAGTFRGRTLAAVGKGDAGAHLRPTTDRVRESLFSVLTHFGVIPDARVLDLFAGTGALGLEALSRGAAHVSFVESGRVAQGLIGKNVELTRSQDETRLIRRDATRLGACDTPGFDLIFLDPPYSKGMGQKALTAALAGGWFAPGALVVWEESAPMEPPEGFTLLERRSYGETHVTLLEVGS
ncbi:16S rRNA (guanine(966)-N(2))-methyltransferase RsmD [Antarcticimicrobium sediminis]|uniref:16S rRNA (Guanine(966)-N(2))-methyltransferase RsmD n=1 Tax=Antarcticimicrobium sediminis TaxID=2546227 RepID=A0A4R5EVX1_9RHOB|nr:16S rRNA (guanine(966)-N(2))-methyltransferase RsmD [Antarcticimicrobium sediminis]TDE38980.1 16S rRNA (guanine(966)-N(2))-methyltransferase RsmD [Antarcticimicrobium sediminis]